MIECGCGRDGGSSVGIRGLWTGLGARFGYYPESHHSAELGHNRVNILPHFVGGRRRVTCCVVEC